MRQNVINVTIFSVSIIFALAVVEVVVRVALPHATVVPTVFVEDVGITNLPGFCGVYSLEGRGSYCINSGGWRDEEWDFEKPEGTIRIAIIGDSYVEALQVDQEQMVGKVLEDILNREDERNYEVLSFGMSGFDAAQAYEALRLRVIEYDPDIVLWYFLPWNDLQDSVREIRDLPWKPYYHLVDGELVIDDSFRDFVYYENRRWIRNFLKQSIKYSYAMRYFVAHYYPVIKQGLHAWFNPSRRSNASNDDIAHDEVERYEISEDGLSGAEIMVAPREGELYYQAWEVTQEISRAMAEFCAERNISFGIVGVTASFQVQGNYLERGRYLRDIGLDMYYPERRMIDFATDIGIPYLPLAFEFLRESGPLFHGTEESPGGHWNAHGHARAAFFTEKFIRRNMGASDDREFR